MTDWAQALKGNWQLVPKIATETQRWAKGAMNVWHKTTCPECGTSTSRGTSANARADLYEAMLGWYFAAEDRRLRHGDGRKIAVGGTHEIDGEPKLCERGLHASKRVIDALDYAPGPILYRVRLSGAIVHGDDKACATRRTYLAEIDATEMLRAFARACALDVIHLWDAPEIVRRYLETGDETIRASAWAAAWAAAEAAAWNAAWNAAWAVARDAAKAAAWAVARDAAWNAAKAAARDAAGTAARAAAKAAAWDAAWAVARGKQAARLERMALAAIKEG